MKFTIKIPSFNENQEKSKDEIKIENTEHLKNFIEGLRKEGKVPEYYRVLGEKYKIFLDESKEVRKTLDELENKGEKKFTKSVKDNLNGIRPIDKENISEFQKFYATSSGIIDRIVRIPPFIQEDVLNYENGRHVIDMLNSFVMKFDDFKQFLAKRHGEYSAVIDFENSLQELKDIEELEKKLKNFNKPDDLINEQEQLKKQLEGREWNFVESKEKNELEGKVDDLNKEVEKISSSLKTEILKARRPITKILYSKENDKLFRFFENFTSNPLDNFNDNFWEIVDVVKQTKIDLEGDEKERLNEFLDFVKILNERIEEYNILKEKLDTLKDRLMKIVNEENREKDRLDREKMGLEEKLKDIERRIKKINEEREVIRERLSKNIGSLEANLSKISDRKVKIDYN
jgi:hypothetical protein